MGWVGIVQVTERNKRQNLNILHEHTHLMLAPFNELFEYVSLWNISIEKFKKNSPKKSINGFVYYNGSMAYDIG